MTIELGVGRIHTSAGSMWVPYCLEHGARGVPVFSQENAQEGLTVHLNRHHPKGLYTIAFHEDALW